MATVGIKGLKVCKSCVATNPVSQSNLIVSSSHRFCSQIPNE